MQTTDSTTFNALRLHLRIGVLDPNGPVRRLYLDVVALPLIFPQQAEIANKVPPHGADLTELRGVLDERVTEGDAAVVRGEGQEPLEGLRDGESGGPMGGMCCQRKRGCTIECVLARARRDRTVDTAMRAKI